MTTTDGNQHILAELVENGVPGTLSLAPDVLVDILEVTARSVDGVTGVMQGRRAASKRTHPLGSTRELHPPGQWYRSRGVQVQVVDGKVYAELSVVVRSGTSVPEVARLVQDRVAASIEKMLGLKTGPIAVHVVQIEPEKAAP